MSQILGPNLGYVKPTIGPEESLALVCMGKGKTRRRKSPSPMRETVARNVLLRARIIFPLSKNLPQSIKERSADSNQDRLTLSHIKRILKSESSVSLEQLDKLAKALEISQYQLLIPDLDPRNPQVVKGATLDEQSLYRKIAREAVKEALAETTPGVSKLSRNQR
jgi:transcriptional regulator with XRE-family HTH domain